MSAECVLRATGVTAGYGGAPAIRDIDVSLTAGTVTVLLGPNGAGKTTTMLALTGELALMSGSVEFGALPTSAPLWRRARHGLAYISDERAIVPGLSVRDNLRLAMPDTAPALELFPELTAHLHRQTGLLSGGQQKMLSLAMALANQPTVLIADELSLGLAPQIVHRLLTSIRAAADSGTAVLLVEQHAQQALAIADRALVLSRGRLVADDSAESVRKSMDVVTTAYLGKVST